MVASSILVGITTTLILFCSHFHQVDFLSLPFSLTTNVVITTDLYSCIAQIEDDKAVGKLSPLVRLGTEGGAKVVKLTVVALYLLLFILGLTQTLPFSSVVSVCHYIFSLTLSQLISHNNSGRVTTDPLWPNAASCEYGG